MRTYFVRLILLLIAAGIFVVETGCKTTEIYVRAYDGAPIATNKVALLKVLKKWTTLLSVNKIDGKPIHCCAETIELLPGQHELWVSYRDSNQFRSTEDAQISFLAEMGKGYELRAARTERSFGRTLGEGLIYRHGLWLLWIIDADTKKVVAGQPRETPLHWYEH